MASLPQSTLDSEIRKDHRQILRALSSLRSVPKLNATRILQLHSALGAHQLAEEETLYACLKFGSLGIINESKSLHLLIDDLVHSIVISSGSCEDVRSKLALLSRLLRAHFEREESEILTWCRGSLDRETQLAMGQTYRRLFDQIQGELLT